MKSNSQKMVMRILCYCLGLLILAFGVAFSVNSNLGVSPVNALPYVLSLITGLSMGICVTGVFSIYIVAQIIIKRKEFQWINLTQICFSTLFGYFVNFTKSVLGDFRIPTYFGQLIMMAISLVLIAIGVAVYMDAKIVNMPMEGITLAVSERLKNKKFHEVKIIMDITVVAIGVSLSFIFLKGLHGIREGTIISAIFVGKLLAILNKRIEPIVGKICFLPELEKSKDVCLSRGTQ